MNNNNLIILALLGIGGYFAYSQYKKSQGASIPGYTPTPSGGGSGGKKQLSFDEVLRLINATLDTFSKYSVDLQSKSHSRERYRKVDKRRKVTTGNRDRNGQ
jgi:hypothetical protein